MSYARLNLPVIDFCKRLAAPPAICEVPGIAIRNYRDESDIARWLAVRNAAFAEFSRHARPWTVAEFRREFLNRWWWRPEYLWLAEAAPSKTASSSSQPDTLGVAGLAFRGRGEKSIPAVHWLAVTPTARRLGIARLLLSHVEQAAWELGHRELHAQTHVEWTAAVTVYLANAFERN